MEDIPAQFAIRQARPDDSKALARVQVDGFRSAYRSLVPEAYLAHFTYQEQEQDWLELIQSLDGLVLLAAETQRGVIVGYALAEAVERSDSYSCELVSLHVLPAYQRRGIGRRLAAAAAGELKHRGHTSIFLWTLAKSPVRAVYEKWGGVLFDRKPWANNDHFNVEISEVAYGWPDINRLLD